MTIRKELRRHARVIALSLSIACVWHGTGLAVPAGPSASSSGIGEGPSELGEPSRIQYDIPCSPRLYEECYRQPPEQGTAGGNISFLGFVAGFFTTLFSAGR
ncbi:hypothetical protein ACKTEK_02190 [Tepidamorphus sp. 3E244]|uniref:hypothetical protein n=1 Tax=Tepidamorphus sp. 3E244 TaxID=3385498 RepID=UPI0038FC8941